ncbi:MAG TPA: hypothetical protein VGA67_00600 [Candidatus Dojkabacteria bacterium]
MKKYELVTLSMYLLGGGEKALDIEDIAMKCEELSPGAFAWRKYKNQINLELVGFAVRDAKKEQYGEMVSGSHAKGWRLTANGVLLAKKLIKQDKNLQNIEVQPTKRRNLELNREKKEITRVTESKAFNDWLSRKQISNEELSQLLRINAYSSRESIEMKIARLSRLIGIDEDVNEFINYVISKKEELI